MHLAAPRFLHRTTRGLVWTVAALLLPATSWAGSNGSTPGQQIGSGGDITFGDYVGIGLDAPYVYFIEVPPGTMSLVVEVLDADIGDNTGNRDEIGPNNGVFDTEVRYEVLDPDGTLVASLSCGPGTCAGSNDAWTAILPPLASPAPGHWTLVVDMSSAVTAGDDGNGYAVRAHDGHPSAGGVELNVYGKSFVAPGMTNLVDMADTDIYYPYVASGCSFDSNEFDFDHSSATFDNAIAFVSRSGTFERHFSELGELSGNSAWKGTAITGFTDAREASDYGIWTAEYTLDDVGTSDDNWSTVYVGAFDAAEPAPTGQPEASTLRIYLATDADGAPAKPWLAQRWSLVSGEPALQAGVTSRLDVTLWFENPTPFPVQFDAATGGLEVIAAVVPTNGGQTVYVAGSASIDSGGTSTSTAESGTGPWALAFAPGVVAAGTSVTMTYRVDVTPTSVPFELPLTGSPAAGGTTATFLDATCADAGGGASACSATARQTALFTFGPLCGVAAGSLVFSDGFESGDTSAWSAEIAN